MRRRIGFSGAARCVAVLRAWLTKLWPPEHVELIGRARALAQFVRRQQLLGLVAEYVRACVRVCNVNMLQI